MTALPPLRVAFLGQATYFRHTVPPQRTAAIDPRFFDARDGVDPTDAIAALRAFAPHAAVVFRPDSLPADALDRIECPVLGVVTEPLPHPGRSGHPNLDYNLAQLSRLRPGALDRAIVCDTMSFEIAAGVVPAWRAMPLPVSDDLFCAPRPTAHPPRIITIGASTLWRENAIIGLKHRFDLVHYAHGLMGDELAEVLHGADVGLVVRGDTYLVRFEAEVLPFLAAGLLTIATALDPAYGLERQIDYLEADDQHQLDMRVHTVVTQPEAFDRVRHRGYRAAQQYRASTVWPRVVEDCLHDLAVFGSERTRPAASTAGA
jgi:hypothetical protein